MAKANLKLYRNTTYNMTYTHVEPMNGGKVFFTVKSKEYDVDSTDASATIKKTVTSFTNAGLTASWQLTDNDLFIDPKLTYYYDIVYEDASGEAAPPIFEGKVKILAHSTNRSVV